MYIYYRIFVFDNIFMSNRFYSRYGRINTCHRLLESMTNTRLLNEGDERGMTPLHLASRGGHVIVVDLLLRKGALFHRYSTSDLLHTHTIITLISTCRGPQPQLHYGLLSENQGLYLFTTFPILNQLQY